MHTPTIKNREAFSLSVFYDRFARYHSDPPPNSPANLC